MQPESSLRMTAAAVAAQDRNAVIYNDFVSKPGQSIVVRDKKLVVMAGITCRQIVVYSRQARIEGPLDVDEIIVDDPRESDAETDADAIHFGGVTGDVGDLVLTNTGQDQVKLGRGSHDFTCHSWFGRAKPRHIDPTTIHNVHQDGWQIMEAQRCSIVKADYVSPTGNNGGIWFNPISVGEKDPERANDPTLIVDCVVLGGTINNNNFGVHIGPSTRCGARNTTLIGKHPYGVLPNAPVIDPIDVNNTKVRVR